ncbi:MAG TPA: hypothetical protein DHU96_05295 [Actinobacteria bacterium]|nr:hypothetical protein [Actinomycetota bacterium]
MTGAEPFVLTSPDLLAADVRLLQGDVDLALRSGGYGSSCGMTGHGRILPQPLPEPDQKDLLPKP